MIETAGQEDTVQNRTERECLLPIQINNGWWLDAVCEFDIQSPGFAGAALRASSLRRQVIAAYLACHDSASSPQPIEQRAQRSNRPIAALLMRTRPRDLLELIFGTCPPGLEGALARTGEHPQPREFYSKLYQVFSCPEKRRLARVLTHATNIDLDRLILLERLPEPFQRPGILDRVQPQQLDQVVQSFAAIKSICPEATEGALEESVKRLIRSGSLPAFAAHWTLRAKLPPPPVQGDENAIPLATVKMMHSEAIAFRNCLRRMVFPALAGERYYYRFNFGEEVGIAQLATNSAGKWYLEGRYGVRNALLPHPFRRKIDDWFAERGVFRFRRSWRNTHRALRALSDLVQEHQNTRFPAFGNDLDDLIEDIEEQLDA